MGVATNYALLGLENPRRGLIRHILKMITDARMGVLSPKHFFRTNCTICPYCLYTIYIKEKIPIRGGSDWAFLVYCYTLYRETLPPSPTHLNCNMDYFICQVSWLTGSSSGGVNDGAGPRRNPCS